LHFQSIFSLHFFILDCSEQLQTLDQCLSQKPGILGPTESYYMHTGSPEEVTCIVIYVTQIPVLLAFDVGLFKFWGLLQDIVPNAYVHDKLILINYRFLSSCSTSVRALFLIVHFVAMEARTSKIYYRKSVQCRCCKVSGFAPVCRRQLHAHLGLQKFVVGKAFKAGVAKFRGLLPFVVNNCMHTTDALSS
jgi:hypothetical protein